MTVKNRGERGILRSTEGGQVIVQPQYLNFNNQRWGTRKTKNGKQLFSCAAEVLYQGWLASQGHPIEHRVGDTDPTYSRVVTRDMMEALQLRQPVIDPGTLSIHGLLRRAGGRL